MSPVDPIADARLRSLLDEIDAHLRQVTLELPELEKLVSERPQRRAAAKAESQVQEAAPAVEIAESPRRLSPAPAPAPEVAERTHAPVLPPVEGPPPVRVAAQTREWVSWVVALALAGGAIALAAAALPALRLWGARSDRASRDFELPIRSASGLTAHDGKLYTVDYRRSLLFELSPEDGEIRSVQKLPDGTQGGLAWGEDCLWTSNLQEGRVAQRELAPGFPVRRAFALTGQGPAALFWDGRSLWVADARSKSLYQFSVGEALATVVHFTLPDIMPAGLQISGEMLWILDARTKIVHRFHRGGLLTPIDSMDLSSLLPADTRPVGLAADESRLWVLTEVPVRLHRFELSRLIKATAGKPEEP